jgi:RNA polymerase sigma-54 factor
MALEQKLSLRLGQRLVMTPSLQQAIKLLQMSKLELQDEIQQELVENPVLEESQQVEDPERAETAENTETQEESPTDPFDEIDYESYFREVEQDYQPPRGVESSERPTFEAMLAETQDLTSHLSWQLNLSSHSEIEKEIGRAIIGNLDETGYLTATFSELIAMTGQSESAVREVLEKIQRFDPVGVAASDLIECLCIQLDQLGETGTAAETIVREHLSLVEANKLTELAKILEIEREDLDAELEIVRHLDPRPGQKFNNVSNPYVTPDVYVVKIGDDYEIYLNDDGLPRLRISPVYRRMAERGASDHEARDYVRTKLRSAFRLIKSIEERQRTILKIAHSIVKLQRAFLDEGIDHMRPLVLKDVADDIGMHESTVSRVVNNKYMHTHRGLFEMRFFFHSGIASSRGGDAISSLSVKQNIRKIISGEDARHPYSDAAIVKILKAEGLKIARRTVAKYREELKVPSSTQRRRALPS